MVQVLSASTDYMAIATWEQGDRTFLIHVATLQEQPVSLLIGVDGPRESADVLIPTEKDLGELIGFWNCQSVEDRTRAAEEALAR